MSNLLPGDIVLAHLGFDISDSVGVMQAHHIPAFTKGKNQLLALEVHQTRNIANNYTYSCKACDGQCVTEVQYFAKHNPHSLS